MGRPAAFDRDQVVHKVTDLFWKQGYLGTSIADVVAVTSLKPGSIYNSFNSKQKLLLEALQYYADQSERRLERCLQPQARILPAVAAILEEIVDLAARDPDAKGCLMVNIWLEMAAHDNEIAAYVEAVHARMEAQLTRALQGAREGGEFKPEADPEVLAKYLMMSIWGLRVASRGRPNRATLEALVEQALIPLRSALA